MNVRKRTTYFLAGLLAVAVTLVAAGCGGGGNSSPTPVAAPKPPECRQSEYASWQKLANEIKAPVYCPSWLPQPLVGKFSGRFFNGRSVDPDRSYLVSFVWFEAGQGFVSEVHVNLRAIRARRGFPPARTPSPRRARRCGRRSRASATAKGQKRVGGETVTVYTANQGADMWHVLYAWRRNGSLYTLSEHVAEPYSYDQVIAHLDRMMREARACRTHQHLDRRLTRKQLVGGGGCVRARGRGHLQARRRARRPRRRGRRPESLRPEQHLLDGIRVVRDNGVEVLVPPLHHQVVTAKVRIGESPAELREARQELEGALAAARRAFAATPAGLGVTIAWGVPYFERYVPAQAERHLPLDLRATAARGERVRVLEDAIRFPERSGHDPARGERSRGRAPQRLARAHRGGPNVLFDELDDLFRVTSIRKGFVGGGLEGGPGLPKQMALAAGIDGAELIPDGAQLFLGFTSTQKAGLGPSRIANFETLGYADLGPSGYFAQGTHMHLSHLFEDVAAWYQMFDFQERLDTTFRPGLVAPRTTQTVAQGPDDAQTEEHVRRDYERHRRIGHSGSIQTASRLAADVVGPGRHALSEGNRRSPTRGLQHARQPVLLVGGPGRRRVLGGAGCRSPLRRVQPDERRLPANAARDGRGPARRASSRLRAGEPRAEASTRFSQRRIGRTSSFRHALTARSRCPSFAGRVARATDVT